MTQYSDKAVLVTGANSGLGYEAAAQLAQARFGRVILACRTLAKAEGAKQTLAECVGSDPFDVLAVDVSSVTNEPELRFHVKGTVSSGVALAI